MTGAPSGRNKLYGTSACHLCEIAEAMLEGRGVAFDKVDISTSDDLFERYGVRIPVLQRPDGRELGWPFSETELAEFLAL
ncbi:MAG: glutaredoxin family protein [Halioglobus sp.]